MIPCMRAHACMRILPPSSPPRPPAPAPRPHTSTPLMRAHTPSCSHECTHASTNPGLYANEQVQKSAKHYTEAARDEIKLLSDVREGLPADDEADTRNCVRLLDWFEHRGPHGLHMCMVFEVRTCLRLEH